MKKQIIIAVGAVVAAAVVGTATAFGIKKFRKATGEAAVETADINEDVDAAQPAAQPETQA